MENTPSKIIKSVVNGVVVKRSLPILKQTSKLTKVWIEGRVVLIDEKVAKKYRKKVMKFRMRLFEQYRPFNHKINNILMGDDYNENLNKLAELEAKLDKSSDTKSNPFE
jgi:hypothetical protein